MCPNERTPAAAGVLSFGHTLHPAFLARAVDFLAPRSSRGRPHDRSKYVDAIAAAPARELARTSFSRDASEPVRGACRIGLANSSRLGWESATRTLQIKDKSDKLKIAYAHLVIDCPLALGLPAGQCQVGTKHLISIQWSASRSQEQITGSIRSRSSRRPSNPASPAAWGDPSRPCAAHALPRGDTRHSSSISHHGNSSNSSRGRSHERSQHGRGDRRSGVRALSSRD